MLPLCSSLSPRGAADGACFESVAGQPLAFPSEPLFLARAATCPSPADCNCGGSAAGRRVPRSALPYFRRPCEAASLPAGALQQCAAVEATGRQRLSSCLAEAASDRLCYSEVKTGGQSVWVVDHPCSDPHTSALAPVGGAPECGAAKPAAAAAALAAAAVAPPRRVQRRPAAGAAACIV